MNTQGRRLKRLLPVPCTKVNVADAFWTPRMETNRTVTLQHEYRQFERVGTLKAYQWDWWDPAKGAPPFQIWVGDLGKWIEAACYSLASHPDAALQRLVESTIQAILKGQKEDGYFYSNPVARDQQWADLQERHELYDVGHTIEAAVAHYALTGKRYFIDAVCRCADLMEASFGSEDGKRRGYDGHPEVELALVKLYRATGQQRYLKLAKFFIDARGTEPNYFVQERDEAKKVGLTMWGWYSDYSYCQAHRPVREQEDAVGHAVRAMYLYSGMADVAAETGDRELLAACKRLWKSTIHRRMYVTGGVGSTASGEAFTFDYDLPNETAYAETCAAIALVFFAHRMLQIEADAEYADVMERALYNGILSGVSLDGTRFFYANHLTVFPDASKGVHGHVAATRQEWFGCACCPPNIARLIAGIGEYAYSQSERDAYVHLYIQGSAELDIAGQKVKISQKTRYPWCETVEISVHPEQEAAFALALRIPGWCRGAKIKVNGKAGSLAASTTKGYAHITRTWKKGDRVELTLPMPIERIEAHPRVRMDCCKVALQRGPIVLCLEEIDNGPNLADLFLPRTAKLTAEYRPRLLGGTVVIRGKARRRDLSGWSNQLYRPDRTNTKAVNMLAVPYFLWANRKPGEMIVWIRGD